MADHAGTSISMTYRAGGCGLITLDQALEQAKAFARAMRDLDS